MGGAECGHRGALGSDVTANPRGGHQASQDSQELDPNDRRREQDEPDLPPSSAPLHLLLYTWYLEGGSLLLDVLRDPRKPGC